MNLSGQGLEFIASWEGFEPEPYQDVAGFWTIGYGHLLRPEESREPIDRLRGLQLLAEDGQVAERAVRRYIDVPLTQGQFDALVSFTFNLGAGALQRSTLRSVINRNEHALAPAEIRRWVYAGGQRVRGLVRRRAAEAAIYEEATGLAGLGPASAAAVPFVREGAFRRLLGAAYGALRRRR